MKPTLTLMLGLLMFCAHPRKLDITLSVQRARSGPNHR